MRPVMCGAVWELPIILPGLPGRKGTPRDDAAAQIAVDYTVWIGAAIGGLDGPPSWWFTLISRAPDRPGSIPY